MSHRKRSRDIPALIAQVAALGLCLLFLPRFRLLALAIIVGVIGVVLGLHLYRRNSRCGIEQHALDPRLDADSATTPTAVSAPRNPVWAGDLMARLRTIDWFQFEKVIAALYRSLGYTVTRRGGANPDGGIDLILERGAERTAVQCKQWRTWKVRERTVREFLGALTHAGLHRGIIVTLCGYTNDAQRLAVAHSIEILDEAALAGLLRTAGAARNSEILAALNDDRKVCPKCEAGMVLRTARKGENVGSQFWGCSAYPRCRYTMPAVQRAA